MGTVDLKSYLSKKVKSKGIVNMNRAAHAAKLSLSTDIEQAISEARVNVSDVKSSQIKMNYNLNEIIPIPLSPMFK